MEACWLFKSLVGSSCGFDAKDRKRQNQITSDIMRKRRTSYGL